MKRQYSMAITWVISLILAISILPGSKAQKTHKIEKFDNSRVKLLYELTFPDCVEAYSLEKGKNGELRVGKVLTLSVIYNINEEHKKSILMGRKPTGRDLPSDKMNEEEWAEEKKRRLEESDWECNNVPNQFGPYGKFLFETIFCGWECTQIRITNLENQQSKTLKEGTYLSCVSENTFASYGNIYNFEGEIINSLPEGLLLKSHKKGFVGVVGDRYYFIDSNGAILKKVDHRFMGQNFDVDYETGTTAIIVPGITKNGNVGGPPPSHSELFIYDYNGIPLHRVLMPFTGYTVGIGVSCSAEYIAVLSHRGWLRLFDAVKGKELWNQKFDWGGYFTDWSNPIPVSKDGKYTLVYGKLHVT